MVLPKTRVRSTTSNMLPQPPLMSTTAMSVALGKDFARAAINACSPELGAHKSVGDVNKDLLHGNRDRFWDCNVWYCRTENWLFHVGLGVGLMRGMILLGRTDKGKEQCGRQSRRGTNILRTAVLWQSLTLISVCKWDCDGNIIISSISH